MLKILSNFLPSFLLPTSSSSSSEEAAANRAWRESVKAAGSGFRRDSEGEGAASALGVAASLTAAATAVGNDPKTGTMGGSQLSKHEKERKIGHRRVGEGGEITYKKIQTSQIMGSIQLGIQHTVSDARHVMMEWNENVFSFRCRSAVWRRSRSAIC